MSLVARADLRHPHRRAKKDGAEFEIVPRGQTGPIMPQLRAVSEAWLAAKQSAEKRFSLGYFDEGYLSHFDIAVVVHLGGKRTPVPAMLRLRHAGSFFSFYDVRPDQACRR